MTLCFATNNKHKLDEVKSILGEQCQIQSLKDIGCFEELPETTGTISGNSKQKANYVFMNYNASCFADDSGLEVEALGNSPGVDSAIYAGPQRNHDGNIVLLLKNMKGLSNRKAQFVTVVTFFAKGMVIQFEGVLKGQIIERKIGTGGFGYDPVFVPNGFSKTLAEMTMEEKNKISHRAIAIKKLVKFLKSDFEL